MNNSNNLILWIAISISIQYQFYILQQKNTNLQAVSQPQKYRQARKKICKIISIASVASIGEKRKSQEVRDLYDDLALVI